MSAFVKVEEVVVGFCLGDGEGGPGVGRGGEEFYGEGVLFDYDSLALEGREGVDGL